MNARSTRRHFIAIRRSPLYSPLQHRHNDAQILAQVCACMEAQGWVGVQIEEADIEKALPPPADLYLNMCQGPEASARLLELEREGRALVNRPSSVLRCHRHRLVPVLSESGLPFPRTVIVSTAAQSPALAALEALAGAHGRVWLKRGGVHAQSPADVQQVEPGRVPAALREFARRGIERVAIQRHVAGPVVKFYAVAGRGFFRWYDAEAGVEGARPDVDDRTLRAIAFRAAALLGLSVFGGDAAVPSPERPVLIDVNDWPSFASFRSEAASAIAQFAASQVSDSTLSGAGLR